MALPTATPDSAVVTSEMEMAVAPPVVLAASKSLSFSALAGPSNTAKAVMKRATLLVIARSLSR